MKSFISILLVVFLSNSVFSQVPKNVIAEHFTNTVCSICASKNPQLNNNLSNNPSILRISYHPSSPYSSCILNQHNVVANDTRTNDYNIYGGTPRLVIQGEVQSPSVNFANSTLFDTYQNQLTFVTINVDLDAVSIVDSIKVRVKTMLDAPVPVAENYKLYVGIAEDTISYNAPNGENSHLNVFRTALNGNSGTTIALPTTVGDSLINEFTIAKHSEWNISRIFAYALIQNTSNMEIEQVGSSNSVFENTLLSVDVKNEINIVVENNQEELNVSTKTFGKNSSYSLYTMGGQMILNGDHNNNHSLISISNLPSGIYVLRVDGKNKVATQKFLKLN